MKQLFLLAGAMAILFSHHEAIIGVPNGVYAASLTPIHDDLSCNEKELARHCLDLIDRGCAGVVLFGTTGEGPSFSLKEKKRAIRRVIHKGVLPEQIIVGIIGCSTEEAISLASCAVDERCAAVLLSPPFFYKNVSEEGVIAFYREVINQVDSPDLKVILYHIPQLTGVPFPLSTIQALHNEFPDNIIGFKDSEGNLPLMREVRAALPELQVFVGNELYLTEATQFGASGAISGIANIYPELILSLHAFGRDSSLPNRNKEVNQLISTLSDFPLFPALKSLLEKQKGSAWHFLRPPLLPLTEEQREELDEKLLPV